MPIVEGKDIQEAVGSTGLVGEEDIARALGYIPSHKDFWDWIQEQDRMCFLNRVTKEAYPHGGVRLHISERRSLIFYPDEYWVPLKDTYVADGQNMWMPDFKAQFGRFENVLRERDVIEEEGVEQSMVVADVFIRRSVPGEVNLTELEVDQILEGDFQILFGSFVANDAASQVRGGGRIGLVYLWDRIEGELNLRAYTMTDLCEDDEEPNYDPEWHSAEGAATVRIYPYGEFEVPGKIDEQDFLRDYLFPPRVPMYDSRDGGNPLGPYGTKMLNFFGIEQTRTGYELGLVRMRLKDWDGTPPRDLGFMKEYMQKKELQQLLSVCRRELELSDNPLLHEKVEFIKKALQVREAASGDI